MRKLVSAATSLVMAATMVGAVAPVVAGAADEKKAFSMFAYKDATLPSGVTSDGATITVDADAIAAGDITIPVGIYLTEGTPDTKTISVQATVKSDNADVKNIKFTQAYTPGVTKFFDSEKTYTAPDGSTFSTDTVVSFAGTYDDIDGYSACGNYVAVVDEKQDGAYTPNAYFGLSWINPVKYKEWFGGASDAYPVVVFDVKLPKGLSNGEYVLDYCDYITAYDNPSCLIETVTKYDRINSKNLDLNTLTIKVGETESVETTTTTAAAQTTTTTKKDDSTTTTTTANNQGGGDIDTSNADFLLYFTDKDGNKGPIKANAGEKATTYFVCDQVNDSALVTAFSIDVSTDPAIALSAFGKKSEAMGVNVVSNVTSGNVNAANVGTDGDGITVNGKLVAMVFEVPEGTPDGLYAINITRAYFATNKPLENPAGWNTVIDTNTAYIQVGEVEDVETTTTTKAAETTTTTTKATTTTTTTKKDDTATTTTTKKVEPGTALYGDTNCDGVVKVNDVVLLNKYINNAKDYAITDQGKINADCYNPKNGEELTADDSKAIIQSIVHLVELPVNK